jgi:hypothetical protein
LDTDAHRQTQKKIKKHTDTHIHIQKKIKEAADAAIQDIQRNMNADLADVQAAAT